MFQVCSRIYSQQHDMALMEIAALFFLNVVQCICPFCLLSLHNQFLETESCKSNYNRSMNVTDICQISLVTVQPNQAFVKKTHFLNKVYFGRAITRAQKKERLNKLHCHLNKNRDEIESARHTDEPMDWISLDPNCYVETENPDQLIKEYLLGLTIHDIRNHLNNNKLELPEKPFSKDKCSPPPLYHLESNRGNTKQQLTRYALQSMFGGRQLHNFSVLSQLGSGNKVIDNDHNVPTVGELVNCKRGKCKQKASCSYNLGAKS